MKPIKTTTRKNWTDDDNIYVCALYFSMLDKQSNGIKFVKSREVKLAMFDLQRTSGSIECKLMNISAIRQEMGLSLVTGYKALSNYQADLKKSYLAYADINECQLKETVNYS